VAGALGLRDPELDSVQLSGRALDAFLGMGDTVPGGHEVQLSWPDYLLKAEAIAMEDLTRYQPSDGL
jgi:hypothetical protein